MPRKRDGTGVSYASAPTLARSVTASSAAARHVRDRDHLRDQNVVAREDDAAADDSFDREHNSRGRVLPPTPREIARCLRMHCDGEGDSSSGGGDGDGGLGLSRAATLLLDAAAMVRIPRSVLDFPPAMPRSRRRLPPGEDEDGDGGRPRVRVVVRGRYDPEASDRLSVLVGEAVEDFLVSVGHDGGEVECDPRRGCDVMARKALAAAETVVDERLGSLGYGRPPGRGALAGARAGERGNGRNKRRRTRDGDSGSRRLLRRRQPDVLIGRKRRRRVRPRAYWTVNDGGGDERNDEEADANEASSHLERRPKRRRTAPRDYWTASPSPSASTNDAAAPSDDEDVGVADGESSHDERLNPEESELLRIRRGNAVTDILTLLLECLQLASLTAPHHSRWRSWGKKRTYEVYVLPSPVRPVSDRVEHITAVRDALEREFAHYYFSSSSSTTPGGKNNRGRRPTTPRPSGCCRVNALLVPSPSSLSSNLLYLQLNLSDPRPLALESPSTRNARTGVRRTNRGDRYLCVTIPGSDLCVLTAGRSPGRLVGRTPFVLATIAGALCCSSEGSCDGRQRRLRNDGGSGRTTVRCTKEYASSMRFMNLSGTDPLDLLSSALSHRSRSAVGRYARLAERVSSAGGGDGVVVDRGRMVDSLVDCGGTTGRGGFSSPSHGGSRTKTKAVVERERAPASDPLVELEVAATGALYERGGEVERLRTASRHGSNVAALSASVADATGGTSSLVAVAVATGSSRRAHYGAPPPGIIVDHGSSLLTTLDGAADVELGGPGDCPVRQRVCWKWTGRTSAASDCWRGDRDGGADPDVGCGADEKEGSCGEVITPSKEEPGVEFKCGVVFEGPNVFDGLRSLVASGLAETPLPDYVRDAPMMGCDVIAVRHGRRVLFGSSGDDFAAV